MNLDSLEPGSEIDGFCLGELLHAGSMAVIYRLTGPGVLIYAPRSSRLASRSGSPADRIFCAAESWS